MRRVIAALAALLLGAALALAWLGYWDRDVLVAYAPTTQPMPQDRGLAAVVVSGDMGLKAGLGGPTAQRFAAHGIPAIGVNSLGYFRHRRSQHDVTALLAAAIRRAMAFGHAGRVVLVGQSFGADMVHYGLPGLAPDLRRRIAMVALVVPTRTVFLRVSPLEMLDRTPPDAPALPTARGLDWVPVICLRGAEESDSLCPLLRQPNVTQAVLPGGHLLKFDADALFAALHRALAAAQSREGERS
ncbi:MAG: virulence factor [Sphingomonadales bacterium]|nr:virulence factor [Sphingomonadales bacterium]